MAPVCGFGCAYYGQNQSMIFTCDTFIKYTTYISDRPIVKHIYVGHITSTFVTADHNTLFVAVEDEGNAKVTGLSTETFEENFSLSVRSTVQAIAASSGSEVGCH